MVDPRSGTYSRSDSQINVRVDHFDSQGCNIVGPEFQCSSGFAPVAVYTEAAVVSGRASSSSPNQLQGLLLTII